MKMSNYVCNAEKWKLHFKAMAKGQLRPNEKGVYFVENCTNSQPMPKIEIDVITPHEAAVQRIRALMKKKSKGLYKKKTTKKKDSQ